MIIQVVRVSIRRDQRDRWLELIRLNALRTRPEEGCESYQVGEDTETPQLCRDRALGEHGSAIRPLQEARLAAAASRREPLLISIWPCATLERR